MPGNAGTSELNGRLWGERASDWANFQEHVHEPAYLAALKATGVGRGTGFLDVGCGAGRTIRLAADLGADVTGLDAAKAQLKIAFTRTPTGSFHEGDLENLPFQDASFDVVTGINAFQYAGNPVAALSEARRVLHPNGRIAVVVWGEPEGMEAARLIAALKPLMPPPPPGAPGPFALSAEEAMRDFARQAGLQPLDIQDIDSPFIYQDLETGVRGLCSAGVSVKAMENAGVEAVEEAYRDVLKEYIQRDGSIHVGATFRCMVAKHI